MNNSISASNLNNNISEAASNLNNIISEAERDSLREFQRKTSSFLPRLSGLASLPGAIVTSTFLTLPTFLTNYIFSPNAYCFEEHRNLTISNTCNFIVIPSLISSSLIIFFIYSRMLTGSELSEKNNSLWTYENALLKKNDDITAMRVYKKFIASENACLSTGLEFSLISAPIFSSISLGMSILKKYEHTLDLTNSTFSTSDIVFPSLVGAATGSLGILLLKIGQIYTETIFDMFISSNRASQEDDLENNVQLSFERNQYSEWP